MATAIIKADGSGNYVSVASWYAALAATLTAPEIAEIQGTWGSPESALTFSKVTSSTNYAEIKATGSARAAMPWSTTAWRIQSGTSYGNAALTLSVNHVRLRNLQVDCRNTIGTAGMGVRWTAAATGERLMDGCHVRCSGGGSYASGEEAIGVHFEAGASAWVAKIHNCVVDAFAIGIHCSGYSSAHTVVCYNNTVIDVVYRGINLENAGTYHVKNNLVQCAVTRAPSGVDYALSDGTYTTATNLSQDATSPNNTLDSKTVTFVDEAGNDFHLASGDTAAKDAGTNLSADGQLAFTSDFDGNTRSAPWDVGAHEYTAGGAATKAPPRLPIPLRHYTRRRRYL